MRCIMTASKMSTPSGVANKKEDVEMSAVDHEKLYGHIVTGDEPVVVSAQRGDANSADKVLFFLSLSPVIYLYRRITYVCT
jgi:hypothetical protein